jgi:glycosyltransferase involved in cell wall biosynthesis
MAIGRRIVLGLSDLIVVEGPSVVIQNNISKYASKIQVCPQYIDTIHHRVSTRIPDRPMQVGFVAALENRKGAMEFAEAARLLASVHPDILFTIVGKGTLFPLIEQICSKIPNKDSIRLIDEIREDSFPSFLNELRLLVVPSKSEGLPNIVLESMASGTPVLAAKVGAIPDVIQHEITGFLLDCNSADCISRGIMKALGHARLEDISSAARTLIETEYCYARALERWSACLRRL